MYKINIFNISLCLLFVISCNDGPSTNIEAVTKDTTKTVTSNIPTNTKDTVTEIPENKTTIIDNKIKQETKPINYEWLHKNIAYGKATLADVRKALTDTNTATLTNTMHALYSMRHHRGVHNLMLDMWKTKKDKYPELAWEQIARPPARIALASTINRMLIVNTDEYKDYIRSFKHDEHEFHRAQVVISLGFNGLPDDIAYIKSMANAENHYVAQSAITALAIMGGNQARNAMLELYDKHKNTPRGKLVETLLIRTYDWKVPDKKIEATNKEKNSPAINTAG